MEHVVEVVNLALMLVVLVQAVLLIGLMSQHKQRITDLVKRMEAVEWLHDKRRQ